MEKGTEVFVFYTITLDDGTVYYSNLGGEPVKFTIGNGEILDCIESAVLDMDMGEQKTVHLSAKEAYGEYDESKVCVYSLDDIPDGKHLPVGEQIYLRSTSGEMVPARITKVEDGKAYFDFNHDLVGKDVTFEITLVGTRRSVDSRAS